jgi:ATP-dependent Clp protease ATP-binding subunit ClpC
VFERFTERARHVIVLAQDESRGLRHGFIGTEHLLLGLLREEESVAARVLVGLGVDVVEVRAQVRQIVGEGADPAAAGQIPFTPRAKKVLELSLQEAIALEHNYIGTEHILLGLVDENGGVASRILDQFGADAATVRNEVLQTLSGQGAAAREIRVPDDVELTSPPLAQEVVDEINRLAAEKERLIEHQALDDAARIRDRELTLRRPAAALVRAWNRRGETGE